MRIKKTISIESFDPDDTDRMHQKLLRNAFNVSFRDVRFNGMTRYFSMPAIGIPIHLQSVQLKSKRLQEFD